MNKVANKLRIIGGEWRSRQIAFDDLPGLRPTPSRVRETLFNWLQADVINGRCLDLYAGSGALGFEAASRGSKRVVQVENNPKACQTLRDNIGVLKANQIELVNMDVSQFLQGKVESFDLVFLDPPFGQGLVVPTCQTLEQKGWLCTYAKVYIESERNLVLQEIPANWKCLKSKVAGEVGYHLFQRQGD